MESMILQQSDTDNSVLRESCGDAPPPKRRRQVAKDRRIRHIVANYLTVAKLCGT